jgi:hypothetical protein
VLTMPLSNQGEGFRTGEEGWERLGSDASIASRAYISKAAEAFEQDEVMLPRDDDDSIRAGQFKRRQAPSAPRLIETATTAQTLTKWD